MIDYSVKNQYISHPILFKLKEDMEQEQINLDNDQLFACKDCQLTFNCSSNLSSHMKLHQPRPHTCKECGKQFKLKQHLISHEITHSQQKYFYFKIDFLIVKTAKKVFQGWQV